MKIKFPKPKFFSRRDETDFRKIAKLSISMILRVLKCALKFFLAVTGIAFLVQFIFFYNYKRRIFPSGFLWLAGIYFSIFTLADTMYQNRIENMESRFANLVNYAGFGYYRIFLTEFTKLKESEIPLKPGLFEFRTTIASVLGEKVLFSDDEDLMKSLNQEFSFDVDGHNLDHLYFSGVNLNNSTFKGTYFEATTFDECSLVKAKMDTLTFAFAKFPKCDLSNATFYGGMGIGARYDSCYLFETNFRNSDIRGINFTDAYCYATRFFGVDMKHVSFKNADLTKASFYEVRNLVIDSLYAAKSLAGVSFERDIKNMIDSYHPKLAQRIKEEPMRVVSYENFLESKEILK